MEYILRKQNTRADLLSKLASTRTIANNGSVIQEVVNEPSISVSLSPSICFIKQESGWKQPMVEYLTSGKLWEVEKEAKAMKRKASFYTIVGDELYCWGYSQPLLKCVNKVQVKTITEEMHKGICGNHAKSRALTSKILRAGYFWPTMKQDCLKFVKKCDKC